MAAGLGKHGGEGYPPNSSPDRLRGRGERVGATFRLRLALSLALSAIYWLLLGISAWIITLAVSLDISPMTATLVIVGTIFFAIAVQAAPSAIGTFEFAMMQVLEIFGVSREAGFGYAVIAHAVFFLPPTIMGTVFLTHEGLTTAGRLRDIIVDRRTQNSAGPA